MSDVSAPLTPTTPHTADADVARGIRAAVLAYVVWGLLTIYWKQLVDFDPFELIAWRVLGAAVVMAVLVTLRRRWPALRAAFRDGGLVLRLFVAAVLLTANWTSYVWAVVHGHVIETALGYFMAPLGTMLLGVTVLHERPTRLQRFALGCAAVAVVVLTAAYGEPPVAALVIAVTWSLYGLLKRRVPLDAIESLAGETFLLVPPSLVLVAVVGARSWSIPSTATGGDWFLVSLAGIVTAAPLLLFAVAAQRVPFTILGPLQYLVPTINFALGWLVYDEELPADRLAGFALVWLALVAVTFDRLRAGTAPADEPARRGYSETPAG